MHAAACILQLLARRTYARCELLPSLRRVAPIPARGRTSAASTRARAAGRRKA